MRTLTLRKAAVVAALPLVLSSLAACGDGSSDTTAADPQATQATQESSAPTTSDSSPTTSTSRPATTVDSAEFLSMVKDAAGKITTARFTMQMDVSGQSIPVDGVIDLTGDTPAMTMTMDVTGMGTPADLRMVDKAVYVEVPGTAGTFYKIDLDDPDGPMGSLGGSAFDSLDPSSMMSQLSPKVFTQVLDRGTVTVHGQELHRFSVVLDLTRAPKLTGVPSSAATPRTAAYDVWLDSEGRMVRFSMLVKNTLKMTATYSDFGAPVQIVAPPSADVVPMPGMSANG